MSVPIDNTAEILRLRASVLRKIRHFFEDREVMEVETPLLYPSFSTDPYLSPFLTRYAGAGFSQDRPLFLQSSPEYAMKRLLGSGISSIYQICKAFRNEEIGKRHNPEFTLIEWYRVNYDYHQLMAEVEAFFNGFLSIKKVIKITYGDFLFETAACDPFALSQGILADLLVKHGVTVEANDVSMEVGLDLLMDALIQKNFSRNDELLILYDYPAWQPQMAALHPQDERLVQRFECYVGAVELANGYQELEDADEQRQRFQKDNQQRRLNGAMEIPVDTAYLEVLEEGFPFCAGVALGIDRMIMLMAGKKSIQEVMVLPLERL